ncbi:PxxKW family cysteine-rich protein, partial [Desulfobulbus sp. F3]|nr:PxxKW family cysteine-rich protein [Desulfobulbus sp. F3]
VEENSSQYCGSFMMPSAKWRLGFCNLATHSKPEIKVVTIKVNPLKAAKRASRKK